MKLFIKKNIKKILIVLILLTSVATYLGYQYWNDKQIENLPETGEKKIIDD